MTRSHNQRVGQQATRVSNPADSLAARLQQSTNARREMTFEDRNAQVDPDPVIELRRRLQPWAAAPDSRGQSANAQIVPTSTVLSALAELEEWRKIGKAIERKKMQQN